MSTTMNVMEHLASEIGVRVGGTNAAHEAANYLQDTFSELGYDAELQSFKFEGYEVTRDWELDVLSHDIELDVAPVLYSESTPEGGVEGTLREAGTAYLVEDLFELPRYEIVDDDGEHLAYLLGNVDGAAFPIPSTEPQFVDTYGLISSDGMEWVDERLEAGDEVRVAFECGGKRVPNYVDHNVIATIEGTDKPDEEVVIGAHYDSAYEATGAADNASGVEALVNVAEYYAEHPPDRTVTFVAYGSEEWWLVGSRYYVNERKANGTLDDIVAKVNIDMAGGGELLNVWAGDGDIKTIAGDAVQQVLDDDEDRHYQGVISGSDHWPYYQEGIPVAMLIFWPYDQYHQPSDDLDQVSTKDIEDTTAIVKAIVDNLDRSPEFAGVEH
ncbi:M28 family metallopeptidase [Halorubrum rutilum]|uniref:M28 family metallopeptidase n=1 Tax=Halorubrum rutilum TaxID=1364933 RepID=A0ABD6AP72_9EURY|nr:M28 family metallopeptidase [Halorubrum rutilum]